MKITIITLFPNMIKSFIEESIIKRAQDKGSISIEVVNLRDYAIDSYGKVDDRPYGGGAGMILQVEPLYKALKQLQGKGNEKTVLTSPKGRRYSQQIAQEYSTLDHLIIIAGHYEEVDQRVREYITEEVSLGDFVMTGGEITATAILDSVTRLIPGVLKKDDATEIESFYKVTVDELLKLFPTEQVLINLKKNKIEQVQLLESPHYTRPEVFMENKVPDVLLSGNHKEIKEWQLRMAFMETLKKRPDLLNVI